MININYNLLQKISLTYLGIPVAIWLLSWLKIPYALLLFAFTASAFFYIWKNRDPINYASVPKSFLIKILALAFLWLFISGAGGFGSQTIDYQKHNALLMDLILNKWPVYYPPSINFPETSPLVYYTGFYIVPAIIGKFSNWDIANIAFFIWAYIGIVLTFLWILYISKSKNIFLYLSFVLIGGLDILFYPLFREKPLGISTIVEWWAYTKYEANNHMLMWVPQHVIIAWITTSICVKECLSTKKYHIIFFIIALTFAWTPFVSTGLLIFAITIIFREKMHFFIYLKSPYSILSVLLVSVLFSYYFSLQNPVTPDWLFDKRSFPYVVTLKRLMMLYCCELSPWFLIILLNRKLLIKYIPADLTVITIIALILIPFVRMGYYNDFAMRTSIPALFILWVSVLSVIFNLKNKNKIKKSSIIIFLLSMGIAFANPGLAFFRSIRHIANNGLTIGNTDTKKIKTIPTLGKNHKPSQYMGDSKSFFFRHLGKNQTN